MKCVRPCCRKEIPDGAPFCPWCGKKQPEAAPQQRKKRRRPKGSGTVYQKKDEGRVRSWVARSGNGEMIGSFETSAEAILALDDYNAKHTSVARLRYTFEDVYGKWKELHYKDIGPKGRDSYERAFAKASELHKRPMRELKTENYQAVITALADAGKSRSMCEKQRQLFSQLCKWAMQNDIITINYAEGLRLPAPSPKKERTLTDDELGRIKAIADDNSKGNRFRQVAQFAMVLTYTGMRIDELLSMRRDDVHLNEGYMIGGEKTDAGRQRVIPILEPIRMIVAEWMLYSIDSEFLLPTSTGRKKNADTVEHSFRRLMIVLGINPDPEKVDRKDMGELITPHSLRRTAATRLVEGKAEPTAVQAILGHADFSTTADYYTSHNVEYLTEEMKKFKITSSQKTPSDKK
nr:MAG TPA: Integrase [Caudoviricetes sp.]